MNEQGILTDAISAREEYSAPSYQRLAFETSGLMQISDIGDSDADKSNAKNDASNW